MMNQASTHSSRVRGARNRRPSGFTLIELLVVAGVIILLLSLVVVAMSAAAKTSQKARTSALMDSMKKGIIRFKEEVGYYPPVLGPGATQRRDLFNPPSPLTAASIQNWWSSAAMADYLVGYGDHRYDGYGYAQGLPANFDWQGETGMGIRNPGPDGVWGATLNGAMTGALLDRMKINNAYNNDSSSSPVDIGKVLGPYLEFKDERLMGIADATQDVYENPIVKFPGDAGYDDPINPAVPVTKVICDYWGTPIRYFRRPYPTGALSQSYRSVAGSKVPTLSDVYLLRPFNIKPGTESDSPYADGSGDTSTSRDLDAAEFALFSAGPDKALNRNVRVDVDSFNADNIVEVGP